MKVHFIHFYPNLMNLYGSYGNVLILKRYLEGLDCQVTVETVEPGQRPDLSVFYCGLWFLHRLQ